MAFARRLSDVMCLLDEYPRQLWAPEIGTLISTSGCSMIWPFQTIYVRPRLEIPLAKVGLLIGLHLAVAPVTTLLESNPQLIDLDQLLS